MIVEWGILLLLPPAFYNFLKMTNTFSIREKVGYSLGDVGANLAFQVMMIYQLKFYTDVFGLDGAVAGMVLLIAPLVNAFVDPLIGIVADRTSTRWGKYRPWVLWSALPFCVFYVLAFWNPGITDKTLVAVYATVSYVLMLSMYSLNNTPYSSLGGVITGDIAQRTSINSFRFVATTIAQFVVQGLTLPLVHHFGHGDAARGWLSTVSLFAAAAMVCFLVCFFSTRERIQPPPQQQTNVRADLRITLSSRSWLSMFVLTLSLFVTLALWGSAMNFYFQSYVDQFALARFLRRLGFSVTTETAYTTGFSLFNTVAAVVQFIGVVLLSSRLANRYGKRPVFIVCLLLTALFTALMYVPSAVDVRMLFVLNVLKSLSYAPTIPMLWAMIGDVADHIEYLHRRRATGICFSGIVFALKMGLGLGGALAGMLISAFGYVSGGVAAQSDTAVFGIRLVSSLIPAMLFLVGVLALFFYPISKQFNQNMQAELAARRRLGE